MPPEGTGQRCPHRQRRTLKRLKGGRVSEEQKGWLSALTRQGYLAVVCKGWVEAKGVIEGYLKATTMKEGDA